MSKGNKNMSKVITRKLNVGDKFKLPGNPSQTYEVIDIKGDYLIYKNLGSHEEFQMVRGFAQTVDLLDESADYQKKRFKEPYYMYNESAKTIKEAQERKKDYLKYIDEFEKDIKKYIDWMKKDVKENKEVPLPDAIISLATSITNAMNRYNNAVKTKTLTEGFMVKEKLGNTYIGRFDSKDKAEKAVQDLAKRQGKSEANWVVEPDDKYMAAATAKGASSWGPIPMNTLVEDYGLITDVKVGNTIIYHGKELKVIQKTPDRVIAIDDKGNGTKFNIGHFNEPIMIKESVSKKNIKSADDLYEWLTEYMRKHSSNRFTTLQIILGNGNNITFAWDMKANKGIHEGDKDYTMSEFVYKFMDPVIKNSGISDIWEVDMDTGRFKPTKESYYIKWGKKYFCNMNGDPAWGSIKDFAIPFKSIDDAHKYMDKLGDQFPMFYYNYDVKVVKESFIITDSINGKPTYFHYGKFTGYDWGYEKEKATKFSTKEAAEKMIEKMRQEGAIIKDMKVIEEGRIAKGYENLDAEEKARHLLSHPSSKYMNDLKSENITERAIRKAVKEMLGKPAKDDPQFITDVNEECDKVEESFLIVGKLPYDDLKQAYISYSDKGLDLHTPEYKKHATRFSSRQEAQKVLDLMKKEGWKIEKFEIVQEEGEAPAIANTTAEVANPELPLKLKEDLESDKAKALEEYKQAKAKYLSDKSDENWKNYIEKKNVCMALGVRI